MTCHLDFCDDLFLFSLFCRSIDLDPYLIDEVLNVHRRKDRRKIGRKERRMEGKKEGKKEKKKERKKEGRKKSRKEEKYNNE